MFKISNDEIFVRFLEIVVYNLKILDIFQIFPSYLQNSPTHMVVHPDLSKLDCKLLYSTLCLEPQNFVEP